MFCRSIGNGVPLVAVAATMQHDPQALMVHQDSPVRRFQDLDGHAVAIRLGASTWFEYLVKRYQLKNVREIPATYSVANFLQDPGIFNRSLSPPSLSSRARLGCRYGPCLSAKRDITLTVSS